MPFSRYLTQKELEATVEEIMMEPNSDQSGYHTLPRIQHYWSTEEDKGIDLVKRCMSRNRFQSIKQNLHLSDNSILDKNDKISKLRNTRVCYRCTKSTSTYETEGILNLSMRSLELCRLEELMHDYLCDYLVSDFSCQECNSTMTIVNKRRVVVEPEVLVIALKRYICNERMEP
nr:unnamed protein product [Callosobruchus chinensis]